MNYTGIIRKVDELGRIVIPIEIRDSLYIKEKDKMEIYVHNDSIVLKKYEQSCIFCGNEQNLINYQNKLICNKCIKSITEI